MDITIFHWPRFGVWRSGKEDILGGFEVLISILVSPAGEPIIVCSNILRESGYNLK